MDCRKVSVIIPVYNVEKYIQQCLDSIIAQGSYIFEIIIVDDGSTDKTPSICDDYAGRFSFIKVIHQKNSGVSAARNKGLDNASGEFISFVDGDDYIRPGMYERLVEASYFFSAEMVLCNYDRVAEDGNTVLKRYSVFHNESVPARKALRWMEKSPAWIYIMVTNRIYRREILEGVRFPEAKIHEDEYMAHVIFDRCRIVASVEESLYCYRYRSGSIMTTNLRSIDHIDGFDALQQRYYYYKTKGYTELLRGALERAKYQLSFIDSYSIKSDEDKIRIKAMVDDYRKMVRDLGIRAGIVNNIIAVSPKMYYRIRRVIKRGNVTGIKDI